MLTTQLIDVLTNLPLDMSTKQRLFVTSDGCIRPDELPSFIRPVMHAWAGGFSRTALTLRLYEIVNSLVQFEKISSSCMLPYLRYYQKTGVVSASVDVCLVHVGIVLGSMSCFRRLIDHIMDLYSIDLVMLHSITHETTQRLSDLQKQYK